MLMNNYEYIENAPCVIEKQGKCSPTIYEIAIFVWSSFAIGSAFFPQLPWILTALLMPIVVFRWVKAGKIKVDLFFISSIVFLSALYSNMLFALYPIDTLVVCLKLSIIFLFYLVLISRFEYLKLSFYAFLFAACLNFAILLAGMSLGNFAFLLKPTGMSRCGTLISNVGEMGKIGVCIFVYSIYIFLVKSKFSFTHLILTISSVSLVIVDGSRTDTISIFVGIAFIIALIATGKLRMSNNSFQRIATTLIVLISLLSLVQVFNDGGGRTLRYDRSIEFISGFFSHSKEKLANSDPIRYIMLKGAIHHISEHPFIGLGRNSSTIKVYSNAAALQLHTAYLQIWANFGIIAFLSYVFLVLSWVVRIKSFFHNISKTDNINIKALGYNSLFLLIYFSIYSFFHPLNNEWFQWLCVLIPAGIYWHIANNTKSYAEV